MKLLLGYKNNNSFMHRLDPRIKLLWLAGNLLIIIFFQKAWILLLCLGLVLVTSRLAGISLKEFSPLAKILSVIGVQIIILQALLYHQGPVIFRIIGLNIYLGGLLLGIRSLLLLLNLALFCLQFTLWTAPEELTLLLVKLRLPPKYAVLVGLALHFLPVMEKDLTAIYESQQARGLELSTFFQKVKGLLPVMLPLILKALKRSGEVALAMELKGYTLYPQRTFLQTIAFTKLDYTAGTLICAFFGLIAYMGIR
ncbi:energy-coupling factor transporter transmembrane component T family protein [Candidatus Formimonas warabiya]|uniref:Energy-coupling factor transporter transmembrane protein EcfT n=1 Tax=Formimonas warabiya TaxID=1761012 RepID=A0A3G1KWZ7_FORW1|nr:energy-coupling factor transporter transmembrane component T [Candidatus Formimonas warabiya]ATW26889.1 hypothetical protein DCMF_20880 [Candidatus Formimonas warabiya]